MKYLTYILLLLLPSSIIQGHNSLQKQIQQILKSTEAKIGVAILINEKDTLVFNNNERYPLMSVMKYHQALAVVHHLEQCNLPLSTGIWIEKQDLLPNTHSPLRNKYPEGNITLSVGELLAYTLQESDNNACDILFKYVGGVETVNKYIRSLGIEDFAISATEYEMHHCPAKCYGNWATPLSVAILMDKLAGGTLPIDTTYTHFIRDNLLKCNTGKERLPSPLLGTSTCIGHKTGTSDQNEKGEWIAINDAGFILLPDGRRYSIAVFVKHSKLSLQKTEAIIARISTAVYQHLSAPE